MRGSRSRNVTLNVSACAECVSVEQSSKRSGAFHDASPFWECVNYGRKQGGASPGFLDPGTRRRANLGHLTGLSHKKPPFLRRILSVAGGKKCGAFLGSGFGGRDFHEHLMDRSRSRRTIPQRLKPINLVSLRGTAKPVPFVGSGSPVQQVEHRR
jgi:hypothetical protein